MGTSNRESPVEGSPHLFRLEREEGRDQNEIDEVLDARTSPAAYVNPCVRVDFLGDVQSKWQGGHFDWGEVGEAEQIEATQNVGRFFVLVAERHIYSDVFKCPTSQFGSGVVSHCRAFERGIQVVYALDCEGEVVAQFGGLNGEEVSGRALFIAISREVDVQSGAELRPGSKQEGYSAFESPTLRGRI